MNTQQIVIQRPHKRTACTAGACLLLLLSGLSRGHAQTTVCGNITSQTWTVAGNPYIVVCDSTVISGQTLTLQPGVIVWMGSNVTLTVDGGAINAVGTPGQRITITSASHSYRYNTIWVQNAFGTNRFNYCDFENAQSAIGLRAIGATMTAEIINSTFKNCVSQAIYGDGYGTAWEFWGRADGTLNVVIENCTFNNTGHGCALYLYGQHVNWPSDGYGWAVVSIIANIFQSLNGEACIMGIGSNAGGGQSSFLNNTILNCGGAIDVTDPWDAKVQNNVFVGTTNAAKVSGSLSRQVGYNDFYSNRTNFTGYPPAYGQVAIVNRNGTPCDLQFNIFKNPQFLDPWSLLLTTNSPCVDAGISSVSDVCFSVSRGTAMSDMGAYGGPSACNWPPLSLPSPPVLLSSPQGQSCCLGANTSFSVSANGGQPLYYQWYFNSGILVGQTGTNLTLKALGHGDAGSYCVVVTNVYGSVTSAPVQLTVYDACIDLHMYAGLNISGLQGASYVLSYSTDLSNTNGWVPMATNTMGASGWFYLDMDSPFSPHRFYKAMLR